MPIYEYRCPNCGATFERLERLGASSAPSCPACAVVAERFISRIAQAGGDCGPSGFT